MSLIGGYYVADLTGSGTFVAVGVGFVIFTVVFGANALGLRVSSGFQLALSAVLVGVITVAVAVALPSRATHNWTPFAPHGWWAIGTAANILMWLFFGWEAMAQLAGDFRDPRRELPRAMALAFVIVAVLYVALAVATISVTGGSGSRVPLADLIAVGFGRAGRDATAVLAVALTMGTLQRLHRGLGKARRVARAARRIAALDWRRRRPQRPAPAAGRAGGDDRDPPRRPRCRRHLRDGARARDVGLLHPRVRARARVGSAESRAGRYAQPRSSRSP